jgi:hypothetical protein
MEMAQPGPAPLNFLKQLVLVRIYNSITQQLFASCVTATTSLLVYICVIVGVLSACARDVRVVRREERGRGVEVGD